MHKSLNMAMLHVIQVFQKVRENMQTDFPRFSGTIKKSFFSAIYLKEIIQ